MKKIGALVVAGMTLASLCFAGCGGDEGPGTVTADYYTIKIACQSEDSEKEVLLALKAEYEKKYPDRKIEVTSFTGKDFESYMLGLAQNLASSPNIIWTSDSYHGRWDEYFTDLRPFYEASAETDYSLYYETMLDTAATNGEFRPTKNYTNPTGTFNREKDANSDGKEHYSEHSDYGLYYAPRDYNKPALLCNVALFKELDAQYEEYFGKPEQTTEERLNEIVAGNNWDDIDDLFEFSKMIAVRIDEIVAHATSLGVTGAKKKAYWDNKSTVNLKLNWEPSYATLLTALGDETIIAEDGSLDLASHTELLTDLHAKLHPADVKHLSYGGGDDTDFSAGYTFMKVVSRPVVLGYNNTFSQTYGKDSLQCIQFPVTKIAAGNSGYAINNYYHEAGISVKGVYKSYDELSWEFIKYIITEEGQEVAGKTGNNIPVLKTLRDSEDAAWRNVAGLEKMNHDAWVAGEELKQDWFYVYKAQARTGLRLQMQNFFTNFQKQNYGEGDLQALITQATKNYNILKPQDSLLKK